MYGFTPCRHLIYKQCKMTNSDILQSDMLDIIFEHRNKAYGAYSLRKGYPFRLLTALGAGLLVMLLFLVTSAAHLQEKKKNPVVEPKEGIVIRTISLPEAIVKQPEQPKEPARQKPVRKIATVQYTTPPKIRKDTEVKQAMVSTKELEGKEIADKTTEGVAADNTVILTKETVTDPGNQLVLTTVHPQPVFVADERDPEFPGGQEGLIQFMTRNLGRPGDLEGGERKVVQIRFKVDKDGSVSAFEIVTSGGDEYDREVLRVCKRMPRWIPAIQNGIHVPVNYMLPVIFIGAEG